MLFRSPGRGAGSDRDRLDTVAAEAARVFGRMPDRVMVRNEAQIEIEGMIFLYDPASEPNFVLAPECDVCASTSLQLFPLEEWVMFGARVRAQARTTCRNCRFASIGSEGPPMVTPHLS